MKFFDTATGNVLETDNEFIIDQFRKHTERYINPPKTKKPKDKDTDTDTDKDTDEAM